MVLAVGRIKEAPLRAVADDYLGRIRRYVRCEEQELKDDAALLQRVPPGAFRVALEVDGQALDSTRFSAALERWCSQPAPCVTFLIGGAEGIPESLSKAAEARISLSAMTLPHRLARVLLYEQIYRAFTIQRGEPYAREG